jgi:hypothetical protein
LDGKVQQALSSALDEHISLALRVLDCRGDMVPNRFLNMVKHGVSIHHEIGHTLKEVFCNLDNVSKTIINHPPF